MMWIEVVDTAVKIGLGAILAGAFAYFTTKLGHESERLARYSNRRRDHLDEVLTILAKIENTYILQKWRIEGYRFYTESGEHDKAEEEKRQFELLDDQLYAAFDGFTRASSILLLFGETESDRLLSSYRDQVGEWIKWSVLDPEQFADKDKTQLSASILDARAKLFASLARSYKEN
jgi:hypothetical protein